MLRPFNTSYSLVTIHFFYVSSSLSVLSPHLPLLRTQYHAFRHPIMTPAIRSMRVHENWLGHALSIESPIATPMRVGIATDQPTIPNMPRPNHTVSPFSFLPRIMRASFLSTSLVNFLMISRRLLL